MKASHGIFKVKCFLLQLSITVYITRYLKIISRPDRISSGLSCSVDENVYESASTLSIINKTISFSEVLPQNCPVAEYENPPIK